VGTAEPGSKVGFVGFVACGGGWRRTGSRTARESGSMISGSESSSSEEVNTSSIRALRLMML
jgi:hypothetical protein